MLSEYMNQYALIALFVGVAVSIPVGMLMISNLAGFFKIRPARPTSTKQTAYEGGMRPFGPPPRRFNIRYYYFALLFVLFDVEAALLYPWAARFGVLSQQFGVAALVAGLLFLFVVTLGFVYAWRKNAVEWR